MSVDDSSAVHYYRNIPEVAIFQGWTPENPQEVSDYAIKMAKSDPFNPTDWYQLIIENSLDGQVIGDIAVCIDGESRQQAELGIALDPKFQKQGFATETVKAICQFLFSQHGLHRIHVSIDPRNTASLNLFARAGFRQEARHVESVFFKGEWCDDIVMAVLSREWQS